MRKKSFNVDLDERVIDEFNEWSESTPGKKFEQVAGSLKAIQAIYNINKAIAVELMCPGISVADATKLLKQGIVDSYLRGWIENLPDEKVRQILEDAKRAEKKLSQKK